METASIYSTTGAASGVGYKGQDLHFAQGHLAKPETRNGVALLRQEIRYNPQGSVAHWPIVSIYGGEADETPLP